MCSRQDGVLAEADAKYREHLKQKVALLNLGSYGGKEPLKVRKIVTLLDSLLYGSSAVVFSYFSSRNGGRDHFDRARHSHAPDPSKIHLPSLATTGLNGKCESHRTVCLSCA
jgi:hypothetical protein